MRSRWCSCQQNESTAGEGGVSSARLKVISGKQKGTVWSLAEGRFTLGRDAGCEFVLDDDGASRRHAEILVSGARIAIRDLQSTNHTYVNQRRIDQAQLVDGDVVGIGSTRVEVRTRPESPAQRPKPGSARSARAGRRASSGVATRPGRTVRRIVMIACIGIVGLGILFMVVGREDRGPQRPIAESGTRALSRQQREQPPQVAATTLEELPGNLREAYEQGRTHFQYGNLARARSSFERVVAEYPGFREGTRSLGRVNDLIDERLDRAFARARSALVAGRYEELRSAIDTIDFLAKPDDPRRREAEALAAELPQR